MRRFIGNLIYNCEVLRPGQSFSYRWFRFKEYWGLDYFEIRSEKIKSARLFIIGGLFV